MTFSRHLVKNHFPEQEVEYDESITVKSLKDRIEEKFAEKSRKQPMEKTHIRTTFLLRRDLNDRINNLKEVKDKGWKTHFFNEAVEELLKHYE
jgi:hypothetical protein